jgi:hypothetical protein
MNFPKPGNAKLLSMIIPVRVWPGAAGSGRVSEGQGVWHSMGSGQVETQYAREFQIRDTVTNRSQLVAELAGFVQVRPGVVQVTESALVGIACGGQNQDSPVGHLLPGKQATSSPIPGCYFCEF